MLDEIYLVECVGDVYNHLREVLGGISYSDLSDRMDVPFRKFEKWKKCENCPSAYTMEQCFKVLKQNSESSVHNELEKSKTELISLYSTLRNQRKKTQDATPKSGFIFNVKEIMSHDQSFCVCAFEIAVITGLLYIVYHYFGPKYMRNEFYVDFLGVFSFISFGLFFESFKEIKNKRELLNSLKSPYVFVLALVIIGTALMLVAQCLLNLIIALSAVFVLLFALTYTFCFSRRIKRELE